MNGPPPPPPPPLPPSPASNSLANSMSPPCCALLVTVVVLVLAADLLSYGVPPGPGLACFFGLLWIGLRLHRPRSDAGWKEFLLVGMMATSAVQIVIEPSFSNWLVLILLTFYASGHFLHRALGPFWCRALQGMLGIFFPCRDLVRVPEEPAGGTEVGVGIALRRQVRASPAMGKNSATGLTVVAAVSGSVWEWQCCDGRRDRAVADRGVRVAQRAALAVSRAICILVGIGSRLAGIARSGATLTADFPDRAVPRRALVPASRHKREYLEHADSSGRSEPDFFRGQLGGCFLPLDGRRLTRGGCLQRVCPRGSLQYHRLCRPCRWHSPGALPTEQKGDACARTEGGWPLPGSCRTCSSSAVSFCG